MLELQRPQHLGQLSQFLSCTEKFVALGQSPSTFLQHWPGRQLTVNTPSFIVASVASTTELTIINYMEEQDVLGGIRTVDKDDLDEALEIEIAMAMDSFKDADDDRH